MNKDETYPEIPERYARHLRAIAQAQPPSGSLCAACLLPLGVRQGQCTGWHPTFKCSCGYEEYSEPATVYEQCPRCEVSVDSDVARRAGADKRNFCAVGDGDGSAPIYESMGTGPVQNANPDVANFESQVVEAAEQVPVVVPRGFAYQIDNEPVQYDFEVLEHQVVDAAIEWRIQLYTPRQFNPPITREQSDAAVAVQNERLRIIVDVLIAARENTP